MTLVPVTKSPHEGVHPWGLTCGPAKGDFSWCERRKRNADVATRIVGAIGRLELDAKREGRDEFIRGQIEGLKEALLICVGEREAVRMLREQGVTS